MPLRPGLRLATLAVHAGQHTDPATGSPATPIYRTTAFSFSSAEEMAETFSGKRNRYIYTRYANPTITEAEERIAALEGGEGAVAFGSGMAAISAALLSVASAGDHVIVQRDLYGGTTRLFQSVLSRIGIEITFLGIEEIERPLAHRRPATKAVYIETPTNPTLRIVDIARVCAQAGEAGVPVIVDNTFATPVNQKPLELGAAYSIHSATKYLSGHGDLVAGVVVSSGDRLKRLRDLRIELGGVLDPEAGWILARSLMTLPLRMQAHNANALEIAAHLKRHPAVSVVHYPGLEGHARGDVASRQMTGFGGMMSFELRGGAAAASRFVSALSWIPLLPTLGGVGTSVVIPAISSHSMIGEEERRLAGVTDGLIRLSVGIEDSRDLIEEIDRALGA